MVPWVARSRIVFLVLSFALLLSACSQVEVESEFETDGPARHSIEKVVVPSMWEEIFEDFDEAEGDAETEEETTQQERAAFEEELEEEIDREELAQEFDQVVLAAVDDRLEVERINEDDRVGVRISIETGDGDDLGEALNTLYNAVSLTDDEITAFTGSFTEVPNEENGSSFQLNLTADGDALTHRAALMTGSDEDDEDGFGAEFLNDLIEQGLDEESSEESDEVDLREWFALTYTISMPGEVTDHEDGTLLDDGRVQLDLPFEGTQTYFIESHLVPDVEEEEEEEESGFPVMLVVGIGAGILVLIAIIGGVLLFLRSREPGPATEPEQPTEPTTDKEDS